MQTLRLAHYCSLFGRKSKKVKKYMRATVVLRETLREKRVKAVLLAQLQANPKTLEVVDLSGGCDGGTIKITVESPLFVGKRVVQQHRLVNDAIAEEMKTLHAASITTIVPSKT